MIQSREMRQVVEENFERYAGNVILDRAICDVRDMLKPSQRMLIYSQFNISKNIHSKPFIKSARIVGDCLGHLYEHSDSSCYGAYMRMGKPFAMRVPLEECQGSAGTIIVNGDEASMRYTELRLSEVASYLYSGLEKNAITEWRDNFDETEKYPGVMPSIGYFNICNGTQGLGIAISSSIPQFNLREVNEAIIALIRDPAAEVNIMPDFATGATLINAAEVKESLIKGQGKACKLRAVMNYDPQQNHIRVTEIPYGVYTSTIIEELHDKMDEDENYGIKSIHDNSGKTPDIIIELEKGVNPKRMIEKLYHDSSLESHFTINMWVLEDGRFPKIMGLKEIFQNYITHIRVCKKREIEYDLSKTIAREDVVKGLMLAAANIDEVVKIIRGSSNATEASDKLIERFGFNGLQTKAILAMKLSSLTKIDSIKLDEELEELKKKITDFQELLNNPVILDNCLIEILRSVADKFGDARRTKIMDLREDNEKIITPEENISVLVMSNNTLRLVKSEDMNGSKRGRKGTSLKLPKNTIISNTLYTTNQSRVAIISNTGKMYSIDLSKLDAGIDYSIFELANLSANESIVKIIDANQFNYYQHIIFVTRNGLIKKSPTIEYNVLRTNGVTALKLKDNDYVVSCMLSNNDKDKIFITSSSGNYNFYTADNIGAVGRMACGVKAMKLDGGETILGADIVYEGVEYIGILSLNNLGRGKISPIDEFSTTSRAVKGSMVQKLGEEEHLSNIMAIKSSVQKINVLSDTKMTSMLISEIPVQNRVTSGVQLINVKDIKTNLYVIAE